MHLTRQIYSGLMQWTNGAYEVSWTFAGTTNQPPLLSIIKSRHAQMDENADASRATFEPPSENQRWPPGWPHTTWMKNIHDDLSSLDLGIHEARDLAENRPLCRLMSLHSAMHS